MNTVHTNPDFIVQHESIGIYRIPPPRYQRWLEETNAFFDGVAWGKALTEGFGATRLYLWDDQHELGHALTIFTKGPVRMAYLGFPVCMAPVAETEDYDLEGMVNAVRAFPHRPDLLRVPISPFGRRSLQTRTAKMAQTIETCITDLSSWSLSADAKSRRAVRRATRRCIDLVPTSEATGQELSALYRNAVVRNHGRTRYTEPYFATLCSSCPSITIHGLRDTDCLVSAVVTARHGQTVCYLHGGSDPSHMSRGVADLVMSSALQHAKDDGATQFNFLASPVSQPELVRFKEKWGGSSREALTASLAMNLTGKLLTAVL